MLAKEDAAVIKELIKMSWEDYASPSVYAHVIVAQMKGSPSSACVGLASTLTGPECPEMKTMRLRVAGRVSVRKISKMFILILTAW